MEIRTNILFSLFFLRYTLLRFDFFVLSDEGKRRWSDDPSPLSIDRSLSSNGVTPQKIAFLNEKAPKTAPIWGGIGKVSKDCVVKQSRLSLYLVLKWWIEFAAFHNIQWWLSYGSLLGQYWYEDELPWDTTDFDVHIVGADEWKVRHFQHPRSATLRYSSEWEISLVARPGNDCHGRMKSCDKDSESCLDAPMGKEFRRSCKGKQVASLMDECAFCDAVGRVLHLSHMDIYPLHLVEHNGSLLWYDYCLAEETRYFNEASYYYHDIAPLQICIMMGLKVPCPNRPKKLIMALYSTTHGQKVDIEKFAEEIKPYDKKCQLI